MEERQPGRKGIRAVKWTWALGFNIVWKTIWACCFVGLG
uniref:Uncharacterized protein n=1 Tax=Arundo donax TaxID=35708 RepID=A0A0A8XVG7_ARUDO